MADTTGLVTLREALDHWIDGRSLAADQAARVMQALTDPATPPALSGAALIALQAKGIVADELRGFAMAMRELARRPQIPDELQGVAIDIVGTGGDASGSVNVSTGTALLVAACGIPVIKHGNRSVSSRSGSADVLEQLGLRLPLDEHAAGTCLAATGFTFLFAPHYHPAMKAIAPVRQALGVRTVFNVLGPLTNPAAPPFAMVGAYRESLAELMAQALAATSGLRRAFVVHGSNGWDEPTPIAPFTLFDVRPGSIERRVRCAADFGLEPCSAESLTGGDAAHNASALRAVLRGEDRGAHRDALLLGAALALECTGEVSEARVGVARAAEAIDTGRAAAVLNAIGGFSG